MILIPIHFPAFRGHSSQALFKVAGSREGGRRRGVEGKERPRPREEQLLKQRMPGISPFSFHIRVFENPD